MLFYFDWLIIRINLIRLRRAIAKNRRVQKASLHLAAVMASGAAFAGGAACLWGAAHG